MAAVDQRIIAVEEETDVEPVRFVLKWSMKNFTSVQQTTLCMYNTGITMAELGMSLEENYRGRWRIAVKPCYSATENDADYVSVFLWLSDEDSKSSNYTAERELHCHFQIRMTTGKLMDVPIFAPVGFLEHTFNVKNCWGYPKTVTHQDLFGVDGEGGRLKDDCLHITIDVLLFTEQGTIRVANIPPSVSQRQREFLGRQLKQLGTGADFLLVSGDGNEFHVDRAFLVAHSPIFAAMLNHDSKEKQTSRCEMEDVDGESVEILLDYVYGCETGKINGNNVEKVLVMADKYELLDLRAVAEITLAQTITVDNAVDLLALARQRNLGTLKEVVLKFIRKNTEAVLSQSNGIESVHGNRKLACTIYNVVQYVTVIRHNQ